MTDHPIVLPEPLLRGSVSTRCIEDVMRKREEQYEGMFKPGQEQLGHFYIPPFQRPAVWSETQSQRLIESVYLGIAIGSIAVSDCGNVVRTQVDGNTVERFPDEADLLIDGQQRLRAIRKYLDNELTVFVGTESEHRFNDLVRPQQRKFLSSSIGYIVLQPAPMDELKRIYDLMNFGGTAHTQDQRASDQDTQ